MSNERSVDQRSVVTRLGLRMLPVVVAALLVVFAIVFPSIASFAGASGGNSNTRIIVVAAENEYGSMAQAIGGDQVTVTSLLSNPNTDPHEFEASASTAITLSNARLVIKNGIGYDSWIDKLLSASPRSGRIVFSVGEYLGHRAGDNPHVWYYPPGWAREASVIAADLTKLDPSHRTYFQQRKVAWLKSLQPIFHWIAIDRRLVNGHQIIATEPVYGYMVAALGGNSLDADFQKAIMDGTDPSPQSVAQFESALRNHSVRMLFYNSQVSDPTTSNMRDIGSQSHIPIVGVTETQPTTMSFVQWQISQLRNIKSLWK